MARFSMKAPKRAWSMCGAALAVAVLLAGCAIEWTNPQPRQEIAEQAKPPGSIYTGWRIYQNRCASCHGADAAGSGQAPDLLAKVSAMGPKAFVGLVLTRYDWNFSAPDAEQVVQRKQGSITMPAWQGEPSVNAHIMDLHAYLTARAEGKQGPGRPQP